ncbi:DHHW family protein [Harryflintia acetispora]|uniref:DHHW motif protein n=1 Tax=Harryflintia acetispora TaxID=1849041 RepID=A0A9X8Y8D1_9FIRM|nr:DHHW family protein [Harryflintia acetispora]TCL43679.1 DHHW motif protein [Harryflintia acetispora]
MLKKTLRALREYPWVILFALFILSYTVLDMSFTNKSYSELENRPLKTRPKMSFSALMSGDYDEKFDAYINDQFFGRDGWITLKSRTESALLKTENNEIVYGKDGYLFKKYDRIDGEKYQANERYIREFFEKYPQQEITFCVVPNSYEILKDKLPAGLSLVDEAAEIERLYAGLPDNVTAQNVYPTLWEHRDDYIYYRTDHHWTTYGAYLAVCAYAGERGMIPPPLEAIDSQKVPNFYGTYFSKAKKAGAKADVITYYEVPVRSVTVADEERDGLYDLQKFETRDKYAAFLWGNNNRTVIESDQNLNKVEGKKTRVLLIKDSYGNCFAPFLCYLYDEVVIADLRYLPKASDLMEDGQYDDVLLMYNFESLASDGYLAKLRY